MLLIAPAQRAELRFHFLKKKESYYKYNNNKYIWAEFEEGLANGVWVLGRTRYQFKSYDFNYLYTINDIIGRY